MTQKDIEIRDSITKNENSLPNKLLRFPVCRFIFAGESNALCLHSGLSDPIVFYVQIHPESKLILPWQRGTEDLRQSLA